MSTEPDLVQALSKLGITNKKGTRKWLVNNIQFNYVNPHLIGTPGFPVPHWPEEW